MKKLLYPIAFVLTAFLLAYSCSTEEEDTTPPPTVQQPTPEPEPEAESDTENNSNTSSTFEIIISSSKGGNITSEKLIYNENDEVEVLALPEEGYGFAGFDGFIPPNTDGFDPLINPVSFTIKADAEIGAFFYWIYKDRYRAQDSYYLNSIENELPTNVFNNLNVICAPGTSCPGGVAILDYNGDGFLDLIHANSNYLDSQEGERTINKFQFFLGDGNGGLVKDLNNSDKFDGLVHSMDGLIGDFNNDGLIDTFFSGTGPDNSDVPCCEYPVMLINSGNGIFIEKRFEDLYGYYHGSASGDLDNDNQSEILLVDVKPTSDSYIIDFNEGEFDVSVFDVPRHYTFDKLTTEIIDINKDGYTDIILGGGDINFSQFYLDEYTGTRILYGNESGIFSSENNFQDLPIYEDFEGVLALSPYDYDNDGDIDLVLSRTKAYNDYTIQVLENNNGDFTDVTDNIIDNDIEMSEVFSGFEFDERGAGIHNLYVGDYNQDGITEIIFNEGQRYPEPKNVVWEYRNGFFEIVERIE